MTNLNYGTFIVVIDTSASMEEMGKLPLAVSALSYLLERIRLQTFPISNPRFKIIRWGEETVEIELRKEMRLPKLKALGKAAVAPILEILNDSLEGQGDFFTMLLISDGAFNKEEVSTFGKWVRNKPALDMRTIAIGPDALVNNLKQISGHTPTCIEDLGPLIDSMFLSSSRSIEKPVSLSEVSIERSNLMTKGSS